MQRTKSLDFLFFDESIYLRNNEQSSSSPFNLRKTKSLDNIHLNVNLSWFVDNKLTRSKSLECFVNNNNHNNLNSPSNNCSNDSSSNDSLSNNSKRSLMKSNPNCKSFIYSKLIDDHNLPKSISDDLFNVLMKYERNRLRTFKDWPVPFVKPIDLSKAGFYYQLKRDFVRCFECKITLFNWEYGDQAILEHYKNNPLCNLLNGYDVGNVPIDKTPLEILREHVDLDEFHPVQSTESVMFEFDDFDDSDEELDENELTMDQVKVHKQQQQQLSDQQESFTQELLFELMKNEEKRLKTFDTWPKHLVDVVKPSELAQCGYFFTTIKDKVICAFCKVPAWDWASTDVPIKEHYKHNPECPLLNDQECGNEPIKNIKFKELLFEYQDLPPITNYSSSFGSEEDDIFIRTTPTAPIYPPNHDEIIDFNELNKLKDLSKIILQHKHVDKYYTYQNRLETFDKWPLDNVKKTHLADAGFYYLGFDDQVKCFSCDLVLSNWSDLDDPWIEHCRYKSNCEYLKLNKGNDFITRNSSKIKNSPKVACCGSTASSASSNSSSDIENEESFKNVCKICMVKEADVVYLPCSHLASCASCTIAMKDCPLCKKKILSTMKIYIS